MVSYGYFPYTPAAFLPTFGAVQAKQDKTAESGSGKETYEEKQKKLAERVKSDQEAALKKLRLDTLKAENKELADTIRTAVENAEKETKAFKKKIKKDGSAVQDTGAKGIVRWGANAWSMLKNTWQSLKGYDKNGKWSAERLFWNAVGVAAGIGICCIPGGAFALAALGAGGAIIGGIEAYNELDSAEKTHNQQKIDEAQQKMCSNILIGVTSVFGSGVIGRLFRTSSKTAEFASVTASKSNWTMKPIEWISNFGKDATVNAWRSAKQAVNDANKNGWAAATKANFKDMTTGSFSWGKTKFDARVAKQKETIISKLQEVEQKLAAETDAGKKALLMEEKKFLNANLKEYNSIGTKVKTKENYDKLAKDNKAKSNMEHVRNGYTKDPATGEYKVRRSVVKESDFLEFQQRILKQQQAMAKELQNVIKAKADMMRWRSNWFNQKKHDAEVAEYIGTATGKRKIYKPSTWLKTKNQLAIGGKNQSYACKTIGTLFTTSALMPAKASSGWLNPIYSDPEFVTIAMLPEQVQEIIQTSQQFIEAYSQILNAMDSAKTEEEFNEALGAYNQLLAMQQNAASQTEASSDADGQDAENRALQEAARLAAEQNSPQQEQKA